MENKKPLETKASKESKANSDDLLERLLNLPHEQVNQAFLEQVRLNSLQAMPEKKS